MLELVTYLVEQLTGKKDAAEINIDGETITIVADKADMGRIIGKQGKIARSIRTIVKSVGMKEGKKYQVEITERE